MRTLFEAWLQTVLCLLQFKFVLFHGFDIVEKNHTVDVCFVLDSCSFSDRASLNCVETTRDIYQPYSIFEKKKTTTTNKKKKKRADTKKIQLSVRANPAPWALSCTMPEGAEEMYKLISFLYFVRDLTRHYIMTPEVSSDLYLARICCRPHGLVRHNFVIASSEKMHFWEHSISKCCGRNSGYWDSPLRVCRLSLSLNNL